MQLPTSSEINAATRHLASAAGGAILMFGLSTKLDPSTVQSIITATGALVNDIVLLIGLLGPLVAGYLATRSASPVAQAIAVAATGAKVVTTPAIAAATPTVANIVSSEDMKVVPK